MLIKDLIATLQEIEADHGNIEVQLQDSLQPDETVIGYPNFFVVLDKYPDVGYICNIRNWPY